MAEKLKIIPLGGLDEIGKNITVLEYGKDMIVIDCGVGFPEEEMYGVDLVIPDFSYLAANQKKLRGFFITHGHVFSTESRGSGSNREQPQSPRRRGFPHLGHRPGQSS